MIDNRFQDKYAKLISSAIDEYAHSHLITVELTPTNACNCNCKYCFENDHSMHSIDYASQNRQIALLVDLCENFDPVKCKRIQIVFWGGEPMLNSEFIQDVVRATYRYDFVSYMMYSNGTLTDAFKKFIDSPIIKTNNYRFSIQLSYDGDVHHIAMRGNNISSIMDTAQLLSSSGFHISFKATLAFSMVKHFSDLWKSYEELYEKFGDCVTYYPTLDTSNADLNENIIDVWNAQVIKVAKYEYKFIQKHGHSLISWYDPFHIKKMTCNLNYHIAINTDGNIYICHGCFYSKNKDAFKLGHINSIKSLYDVLHMLFNECYADSQCYRCGAIFCNVCHIACVNPENFVEDWYSCRVSNKLRCKCFKQFSKVFNALTLALIDHNMLIEQSKYHM